MAEDEGEDKDEVLQRVADNVEGATTEDVEAIFGDPPYVIGPTDHSHRSIKEQLEFELAHGTPPAVAVGALDLDTENHDLPDSLSRKLSTEEATRLYLYRELTDEADTEIAEKLQEDLWRTRLQVFDSVSHKTVGNIAERVDPGFAGTQQAGFRQLAQRFEDTGVSDYIRDPPEVSADGVSAPEVTMLSRQMRTTGYACIQLNRDESRASFGKWELFKPWEHASRDNHTPNDSAESLKTMPSYWHPEHNPPGAKALWNQLRNHDRNAIRRMFLTGFEQFLDLALRQENLLQEPVDVAVDLTGWPWFGRFEDEETPTGVQGTKAQRNYQNAWQYATLSLVDTEVPLTVAVRAVAKRSNKAWHLKNLLNYAETKLEIGNVYLDSAFYETSVRGTLEGRDFNWVIKGQRRMDLYKDLVSGAQPPQALPWNAAPWEMGADNPEDGDHWLVVHPSAKRMQKADTGFDDPSNWDLYYTNLDPYNGPRSGHQIASDYRLRWAIETNYRVLKEDFLAKSGSSVWEQRTFLFNLGMLYYDMWVAANVLAAGEGAETLTDDQGRYPHTANNFMNAIVNDMHPVEIGEVDDLSEKSEMLGEDELVDTDG